MRAWTSPEPGTLPGGAHGPAYGLSVLLTGSATIIHGASQPTSNQSLATLQPS